MLAPLSPTEVPVHRIPRSSLLTAVRAHRILRLSWRMVALGRRIPPLSLHNWPNAEARTTDVIRACNVDRTPRRSDHVMVKLALINSKEAVLVRKGHSSGFIGTMYYLLTFMLRCLRDGGFGYIHEVDLGDDCNRTSSAAGPSGGQKKCQHLPRLYCLYFYDSCAGRAFVLGHPGIGIFFTHFLPHRVGDAGRRDGGSRVCRRGTLPACSRPLPRCVASSPLDIAYLRHSRPAICASGRQPSIETVVKQRRARAGTRCSRRYRHAAALRPLLRYYGGAPAPPAGNWPLPVLVCLGSERRHPGTLGQPLRFLLEPLGNGRFSRLPALVELGISPPRSTNGRQSDVRGRHRIHEHRSGNEFAFALPQ